MCCSPWGHKELDTTEWLNWKLYFRMSLEPLNTASKTLVFYKYLNKVVGACSLDEIHGSWTYSRESCWAANEALWWQRIRVPPKGHPPIKIQLWEAMTFMQVSFSLCKIFLRIPFYEELFWRKKELFWIPCNVVWFTKSPSVHNIQCL